LLVLGTRTCFFLSHKTKDDYGVENVRLNSDKKLFTVKIDGTAVAFYDENAKHWKFVEVNNDAKRDRYNIIPQEVFK
jgi:hypothetical protein